MRVCVQPDPSHGTARPHTYMHAFTNTRNHKIGLGKIAFYKLHKNPHRPSSDHRPTNLGKGEYHFLEDHLAFALRQWRRLPVFVEHLSIESATLRGQPDSTDALT